MRAAAAAKPRIRPDDQRAIETIFDGLEASQSLFRSAYLVCAMVWCFFSLWPTTYVEWAGLPLFIALVVQFIRTPRVFVPLLLQPLTLLVALFWAWEAISLLWSPDLKLGMTQVGCARWIWVIPALWPVMNRRRWLIGALVCGFLAGNLSQALHTLGVRLDIHALTWPRPTDRNSGWWDPVIGGSVLTAALGLHLAGAAFGSGRWRAAGLAGCAVTVVSIAVTGTRGAWLAAAALLVLGAAAGVGASRARGRALGVCASVVVVIGAAVWFGPRESVVRRFESGRNEIVAYFRDGAVTTDTGARLMMARRALEAFRASPLGGVGAGGFRVWLVTGGPINANAAPVHFGHAHAHNSLLHAAATTGLPGALFALAVYFMALSNARRAHHEGSFNAYDRGPFWALVALGLVSPFDSIQVNSQTAALLMTLIALSPTILPRARGWPGSPITHRAGAVA